MHVRVTWVHSKGVLSWRSEASYRQGGGLCIAALGAAALLVVASLRRRARHVYVHLIKTKRSLAVVAFLVTAGKGV